MRANALTLLTASLLSLTAMANPMVSNPGGPAVDVWTMEFNTKEVKPQGSCADMCCGEWNNIPGYHCHAPKTACGASHFVFKNAKSYKCYCECKLDEVTD